MIFSGFFPLQSSISHSQRFSMSVLIKLACFLLTIWTARGTIIYTAQCQSRCRSLYKDDQRAFSQCLAPCVEDFSKLGSCRTFCGDDNAPCHYSCKWFKNLYIYDYGTGKCPSKKPFYSEYCDKNIRCDELKKCCSKTNSCEDVVVDGEEVKAVVTHVTSSSMTARWEPSNITNAVYIIQLREVLSTTIYYTEDDWTDWEQKQQGFDVTGVKITHLPSGVRLQLRVAIVNKTGLQSIGPATPVIRTLFNASRPSRPEDIWIKKKTFKQNLVSVTLGWTPPIVLDVPVHSYHIYWKQIPLITTELAVVTKKRTHVDGTQYNYTIENLKPDTTYKVEIEAVCLWHNKRLKSPKVAMNISTGHIKDNGKGIIELYFTDPKTRKDKNKNSSRHSDEAMKDIDVLIEQQDDNTKSPTTDPNKSGNNSGSQRYFDEWLSILCLVLVILFAS